MRLGAVFPFEDIGEDPGAVRAFTKGIAEMGYGDFVAYDHVIGANPESRPGWDMPYVNTTPFYEPLTLFSHVAAFAPALEFISAVMILPQRQAALVAKQAATVDVLCGGRLRLGVGSGWNEVEYEALGADFANRGDVFDEQIDLLRALWAEPAVTFSGRWHQVSDAGIYPLPPHRRIPIWIGGTSGRAIRRTARTGDGWLPYCPANQAEQLMEQMMSALQTEERQRETLEIDALIFAHPEDRPDFGKGHRTPDEALSQAELWQKLGADRIAVHTMASDAGDVEGHLRFLEEFMNGFHHNLAPEAVNVGR